MKRTHISHWRSCCIELGWSDASMDTWHERLMAAYAEPQRFYHTQQHLNECLSLVDSIRIECSMKSTEAVEMALWFHDAIYDPRSTDNEKRSADLALGALGATQIPASIIARIKHMILLTKAHRDAACVDDAVLLDVDLAILGQSADRFDEYEQQIRGEYSWVSDEVYRVKRAEILHMFLQQKSIYQTNYMRSRFERSARQNLQRLIAKLQ